MKNRKHLLLHCLLPLLVSLGIYVLFRPRNTIVNELLFQFMTTKPPMLHLAYCRWIVHSLPGALWLYSFLSFSAVPTRRLLSLLPLAMALGIEVVQYLHITDGRFDWLDVAFYLGAWLVFSARQWGSRSPLLPEAPRPRLTLRYKFAYGFFIGIVLLSDVWFK
ncbi:hypothetical protein [Hymenobacter lucidus]|uniref:VanZ family protein n=1 Tax=Hymenobacter lucidus TaxID=2880930 RepID=A0ABS8ARR1_9BACT|nr:hypothetical protein [Hymenobacter lucidus]MCB2408031.1 hypothetical protein [Hymenobacter lucidus]